MILKFSLVISFRLVCNKDTDIEALAPASVFTIVLSCLVLRIRSGEFSFWWDFVLMGIRSNGLSF